MLTPDRVPIHIRCRIVDRTNASRKGATVEAILQSLQVRPGIASAPGERP